MNYDGGVFIPLVNIPDNSDNRFCICTNYLKKKTFCMNETFCKHTEQDY